MDIRINLDKYNIVPDPLKDQFFIQDDQIIKKIIYFSDLKRHDVVLEVGSGIGNLTKELAKKVNRVITFEIDKRFKPFLDKLPKNVEVHFENAWNYVQLHGKFKHKKEYNKIVCNPPYSFIEQFLHNLTFLEYDKVIFLVPTKIIRKIETNGIFSSFFKTKILLPVPKESFYPVSRSNSVILDLIKLPDPIENKNQSLFLRQYLYQHENQLVKNSLMEGLIKYQYLVYSKNLTKNEAREIIKEKNIPEEYLDITPNAAKIYELVGSEFRKE